jgi:hypothetical protein
MWTPIVWFCLVYDIVLIAVGSVSFSLTGYPGGSTTFITGVGILVLAVLLFIYRTVVEDKRPWRWNIPDEVAEPAIQN